MDKAGNQSRLVLVKNPNDQEPKKEQTEEKEEQKKEECVPQTEKAPCPEQPAVSETKPPVSSNTTVSNASNQMDYTKPSVSATVPKQTEQREEMPLTPNGQATVLDHATGEDGKEFFTITTADNNVFYLIVDRQREEENVYFLNAVTETDLLSLAQADDQPELILEPEEEPTCNCTQKCEAGDVNTLCPVCKENRKACVGEVPEEPEPEAKESNAGLILFVVLIQSAEQWAGILRFTVQSRSLWKTMIARKKNPRNLAQKPSTKTKKKINQKKQQKMSHTTMTIQTKNLWRNSRVLNKKSKQIPKSCTGSSGFSYDTRRKSALCVPPHF